LDYLGVVNKRQTGSSADAKKTESASSNPNVEQESIL
jgi:hypothetical protein